MHNFKKLAGTLVSSSIDSIRKLRSPRSLKPADVIKYIKTLAYFLTVLSVLVLVMTGFLPYLVSGNAPAGYVLMLHVSAAPVFAVCITVLILFSVHRNRFSSRDQIRNDNSTENIADYKIETYTKIAFWFILILTILIMGSIVLSMYTFFGTNGQEFLLNLHLVSSVLFFAAAVYHTYLLINSFVSDIKNE